MFEYPTFASFARGVNDEVSIKTDLDALAASAKRLLRVRGRKLRLAGYVAFAEEATAVGRERLALSRATTLRKLLIERGIAAHRLVAVAHKEISRHVDSAVVLEPDPRYPQRGDFEPGSDEYKYFCDPEPGR